MMGRKLVIASSLLCSCLLSIFLYQISVAAPISFRTSAIAQESLQDRHFPNGLDKMDRAENISQESNSVASCQLSEKYPPSVLQWCELITQYALKHGLDPNLIAALILQESGGDPVAYSKSGAVGLMQVMPSDGLAASFQCINGPCFANRPTIAELQDPVFNLAFGTKMLAGLIKRHGELREALRDYGPANVGYTYADKVIRLYELYR